MLKYIQTDIQTVRVQDPEIGFKILLTGTEKEIWETERDADFNPFSIFLFHSSFLSQIRKYKHFILHTTMGYLKYLTILD